MTFHVLSTGKYEIFSVYPLSIDLIKSLSNKLWTVSKCSFGPLIAANRMIARLAVRKSDRLVPGLILKKLSE